MNANELADKLDEYGTHLNELASTTLRQQQAEIKALKKLVSEMKYEKSSGVYEMNNEPVAWMDEINTFVLDKDYKQFPKSLQNGMIPLYTHPVKEKGLPRSSPSPMNQACLTRSDYYISDEVIEELAKQFGVVGLHEDAGLYEFARAILKKASEK